MNWNALGAIAAIIGVGVAVYYGHNTGVGGAKPYPNEPPPVPQPDLRPPVDPAPNCLALKLPACPDNANAAASEIIRTCEKYTRLDSKTPTAYSLIGRAYRTLGRLGEAEAAFETQLRLAQTLNDAGTIGQAYFNLASIQLRRGVLDRAEYFIEKSLEQAKNSEIGQAVNFKAYGDIYYKRSDFFKAEKFFQRSTEHYLRTEEKIGLGAAYTGLGFSKLRQRNRSGCQYLHKAKALLADISCYAIKNQTERHLSETKCY